MDPRRLGAKRQHPDRYGEIPADDGDAVDRRKDLEIDVGCDRRRRVAGRNQRRRAAGAERRRLVPSVEDTGRELGTADGPHDAERDIRARQRMRRLVDVGVAGADGQRPERRRHAIGHLEERWKPAVLAIGKSNGGVDGIPHRLSGPLAEVARQPYARHADLPLQLRAEEELAQVLGIEVVGRLQLVEPPPGDLLLAEPELEVAEDHVDVRFVEVTKRSLS